MLTIIAIQDTWLKKLRNGKALQSRQLEDNEKNFVPKGKSWPVDTILPGKVDGHIGVVLAYGSGTRYIWPEHFNGLEDKQVPINDKSAIDIALPFIAEFEGLRLKAYADPLHGWSVATIGMGTTYYPDGTKVKQGDIITKEQAYEYKRHYVEKEALPVLNKIPNWPKMNANQQAAIMSFAFNLGYRFYTSSGFTSMQKLINFPDKWSDLSYVSSVFVKYRNPGSNVEAGLKKRRLAEAELFCKDKQKNIKTTGEGSFVERIVSYCEEKGYKLSKAEGHFNIVYVEGVNLDGSLNNDKPNEWNDVRLLIRFFGGKPAIVKAWEATTEPGSHYTYNKMNSKGAARIKFGYYKAWKVGSHRGQHEALIQTGGPVTVHRDFNKDFKRTGDKLDSGLFGINQHNGYDMPKNNIGRASAGCLVGRTKAGHAEFMNIIKQDSRYKANHNYIFDSWILPGDEL